MLQSIMLLKSYCVGPTPDM